MMPKRKRKFEIEKTCFHCLLLANEHLTAKHGNFLGTRVPKKQEFTVLQCGPVLEVRGPSVRSVRKADDSEVATANWFLELTVGLSS